MRNSNRRRSRILDAAVNLELEKLEPRQLLSSVSLSNGVLNISGNSSSANDLQAYYWNGKAYGEANGTKASYSISSVKSIKITGGSKNDFIWIDRAVTQGATIDAGDGNDDRLSAAVAKTRSSVEAATTH